MERQEAIGPQFRIPLKAAERFKVGTPECNVLIALVEAQLGEKGAHIGLDLALDDHQLLERVAATLLELHRPRDF